MSNYDELVEFRNKLTNDTDCVIFEEDCQLLDRILDDLEQKDQRIAELEEELASQNFNELVKKKYDSLKEAIKFLWEKQITDEHIFYVIDQLGQQHIDRIQDIENGICEIERLEKELAETNTKARELVELNLTNEMLIIDLKQQLAEKDKQLQNAVFPKFKVGDEVWFLYSTIYYLNKNKKDKICKGKITRVISYEIDNRDNLNVDNIFTKAEAEEALKKLEK